MDTPNPTTEEKEVTKQAIETEVVSIPAEPVAPALPIAPSKFLRGDRGRGGDRGQRKNPRRSPRRDDRVRPEFDQKIISIRRVTRVMAGGRRFSFSVAIVAGNRKGMVGVGTGKGGDTALAIEKAFRDAKKNMITVPLVNGSIPHDSKAKYGSSVVMIMPARGRGLVAGGAVRTILEFAGVKGVAAKILSRSKNGQNNAEATILALSRLVSRKRH